MNKELITAILNGNKKCVLEHLSKDTINLACDKRGAPLLHYAIRAGDLRLVQDLLLMGSDVEKKDNYNMRALHVAAKAGELEIFKCLLENKADISAVTKTGFSAYLLAAKHGHLSIVQFLVENNLVQINELLNGVTALYYAADRGQVNIVKYLFGKGLKGLESHTESNFGFALSVAMRSFQARMENLNRQSKKIGQDKVKKESLQIKKIKYLYSYQEIIKILSVPELLDLEIVLSGYTPFLYALSLGQTDLAKFFLSVGSNPHIITSIDETALHVALEYERNDPNFIIKLIESGIDVSIQTCNGGTALHYIPYYESDGEYDYTPVVEALLKSDKNRLQEIEKEKIYGIEETEQETRSILEITDYCNETPLHQAVRLLHADLVSLLLKNGANAVVLNDEGETPLLLAAKSLSPDIAPKRVLKIFELLLKYGDSISRKDYYGRTVLSWLVLNGRYEEIEQCLKWKANIFETNRNEESLLHVVCLGRNPDAKYIDYHPAIDPKIIDFLLKQGLDPNAKDLNGNTPLHFGYALDKVEILQMLIDAGANLEAKNNKGETALFSLLTGSAGYDKAWCQNYLRSFCFKKNLDIINFVSSNYKIDFKMTVQEKTIICYALRYWDDGILKNYFTLGAYLPTYESVLLTQSEEYYENAVSKNVFFLQAARELIWFAEGKLNKDIQPALTLLGNALNARRASDGNTALHLALLQKNPQIRFIWFLLEKKAKLLLKNDNNVTALELLLQHENPFLNMLGCYYMASNSSKEIEKIMITETLSKGFEIEIKKEKEESLEKKRQTEQMFTKSNQEVEATTEKFVMAGLQCLEKLPENDKKPIRLMWARFLEKMPDSMKQREAFRSGKLHF